MMEKKELLKMLFGITAIIAGILLNAFKIGMEAEIGLGTLGNWLIFVGFISLTIIVFRAFSPKRIVDERMLLIASKANRIVFVAVIIAAFTLIIVDGIHSLEVDIGLFMAYFVSAMLAVYVAAYKIIEINY